MQRNAEEVSFEWSHHRILSTDCTTCPKVDPGNEWFQRALSWGLGVISKATFFVITETEK